MLGCFMVGSRPNERGFRVELIQPCMWFPILRPRLNLNAGDLIVLPSDSRSDSCVLIIPSPVYCTCEDFLKNLLEMTEVQRADHIAVPSGARKGPPNFRKVQKTGLNSEPQRIWLRCCSPVAGARSCRAR